MAEAELVLNTLGFLYVALVGGLFITVSLIVLGFVLVSIFFRGD
jgi:hypothetical protein